MKKISLAIITIATLGTSVVNARLAPAQQVTKWNNPITITVRNLGSLPLTIRQQISGGQNRAWLPTTTLATIQPRDERAIEIKNPDQRGCNILFNDTKNPEVSIILRDRFAEKITNNTAYQYLPNGSLQIATTKAKFRPENAFPTPTPTQRNRSIPLPVQFDPIHADANPIYPVYSVGTITNLNPQDTYFISYNDKPAELAAIFAYKQTVVIPQSPDRTIYVNIWKAPSPSTPASERTVVLNQDWIDTNRIYIINDAFTQINNETFNALSDADKEILKTSTKSAVDGISTVQGTV